MRYSLLSRFQGALLGAALGEALGAYAGTMQQLRQFGSNAVSEKLADAKQERMSSPDLYWWRPGLAPVWGKEKRLSLAWGKVAVGCAQDLIALGGWCDRKQVNPIATIAPFSPLDPIMDGAALAIATLPLMLFYHENERKLYQSIQVMAEAWSCPAEAVEEAITMGDAIAQILQAKLNPIHLMSQLLSRLHQTTASDANAALMGKLTQLPVLLQQSRSLPAVVGVLQAQQPASSSGAIALALYCFLSTPAEPHLALSLAARSGYLPLLTCALVGALTGAYNGVTTLPFAWQLDLNQQTTWGLSGNDLETLAADLLAVWAGADNPATFWESVPAIAAPGVMRPR